MRRLALPLMLGAVAAGLGIARAEAPGVDLRFRAESTCGSREALVSRLRARGVTVTAGAVPVEVRATHDEGGAEGTFSIGAGDGAAVRTLTAESCGALLDALAFAVELAAAPDGRVASTSPDAATLFDASPDAATLFDAAARTSGSPTSPSLARSPAAADAGAQPTTTETTSATHLEGSATGGIGFGLGTSPLASTSLAIEIEGALRRASPWSPSIALGLVLSLPTSTRLGSPATDVAFAAQGAAIVGCPLRVGAFEERVELRPCLRFEAGRTEAKSDGVVGAKLTAQPYLAIGPSLRGRVRALGPVFVELSADVLAALARSEFFLDNTSIYETSPFRMAARFGVGVTIP